MHELYRMIAVIIEELFALIGTSASLKRQFFLALDKFLKTSCSYERFQLVFLINTHTIIVTFSDDKLAKIYKLLRN